MKIGIFGGTFNPIHNGHLKIAEIVKNKLNLDLVYIVPTYETPGKSFQVERIDPKHRYNMVKKSIKDLKHNWLKILDFEYKNKEKSYTYKTINYLKSIHPEDKFYLIMGEDRYFGLNNWKNIDQIKAMTKIVVFRRSSKIKKYIGKESIYIKDMYFEISSSMILKDIRWDLIPDSAIKYISKHKLYFKTLVFNVLGRERYQHSIAVASHSRRLSNQYFYFNKKKSYNIGLIHDLFKLHNINWLRDYYIKNSNHPHHDLPPEALHGFVCALWLKNEYKIKNKKYLTAIERHTFGHPKSSKIDKIIFVADKISTDRKGNKVGKIRKLAYNDLNMTYRKLINNLINNLNKKGIKPYIDTVNTHLKYNNLLNKKLKNEFKGKK